MRSRRLGLLMLLLLAAFIVWAWPQLPARMAVHWNGRFEPDGWGTKVEGALVMPAIVAALWLGLPLLRRLDPRRENYARFEATFWLVVNILVLMLSVLAVATIGYNLGWPIEMRQVVLWLIGLLFVGLGNYMPRIRPNWFMGIRTPWTLSSDRVWTETHRLGGRAMVVGGLLTIAAAFAPAMAAPGVALVALAIAAGVPSIYSYFLWRRETRAAGRP